MPDLLAEKHSEIIDRLKQLTPLVEEHRRLQAADKALADIDRSAAATFTTRPRKPRRRRAAAKPTAATAAKKRRRLKKNTVAVAGASTSTATTPAKRRAGRRKGSGTRAAEALAHIQEQPGITIPELAAKMGIKQNYLYRVLPALQKERKVTKQDKGWHPRHR